MKSQRIFATACAAALLLISARSFATDDKCRDAFDKANRNVANQEQKANRKCVKDGTGDVSTSCVNYESAKAADKRTKVTDLFLPGGKCETNAAFGVINTGTPAGSDAVDAIEAGTDNIIKDLWGDPADGVTAGDKCADATAKRTGKIYDTILKAFRGCVKTPVASLPAETACVATAIGDAKVATFAGKLDKDANNKCANPNPDGTDDGKCAGSGTQSLFATCAVNVAKCDACLAINSMTGTTADCATLSGDPTCGVANNTHACTFDGATDNSSVQVCFLGVCPAPINVSGKVDINCPGSPDGNGQRVCDCSLDHLDPFALAGVGTICVDPAPGCGSGTQDCDGGSPLNIDMIADHGKTTGGQAGAGVCTSNAQCATRCGTYCSGIGKAVYLSGCEEFCQGGARADQACICDTAGAATCSGGVAGVNDCPAGSCEGKDNDAAPDQCHCWCVDEATAPASPAGSLECRVGVAIRVEADAVCDNVQVLVRLPAQCAPFTSGSASVTLLDANEAAGSQGPYTDSGSAETCANFDASTTTGYELVSDLAFFDSTIGDLESRLHLDCQ